MGVQLWLAGQGDFAPLRRVDHGDFGTKAGKHPLGVVAGRFLLDHNRLTRRIQTRKQNGGFHLSRGHGHDITHRHRVRGPNNCHRQAPARAAHRLRTEQCERIGHARHRAFVQAGVARERHCHIRGRHAAHDQPYARTGVAAVNHLIRLGKTTNTDAVHMPCAILIPRDVSTKGLHRLGGIQNILPLKQPGDDGLSHRHRPQNERAVRDRLIAGHVGLAVERATRAGGHRNGGAVGGHGGLIFGLRP